MVVVVVVVVEVVVGVEVEVEVVVVVGVEVEVEVVVEVGVGVGVEVGVVMTTAEIEKLVPWGDGKLVETRVGFRTLRTAEPTEDFWQAWRANKNALSAAGVSCSIDKFEEKKTGKKVWRACWWQDAPKELTEKFNNNIAGSQALNADVDLPRPEGLDYMGFQKAGIKFALDKEGVLFGDEMGLGKTIQAIGVINADPSIKRFLVVCPASLKINWLRELQKWLVRDMRVFICDSGAGFPDFADGVIINFDILKKFQKELQRENYWDCVILDEAHFIKSKKAIRTQCVKSIKARRRLVLTGTPIPNRASELFEIVNFVAPDVFPSWWKFVTKYCGAVKGPYGMQIDCGGKLDSLTALQTKLRSTIMVRRLKADVLTELPPKRRQVIEIPCDESIIAKEFEAARGYAANLEHLQVALELAKVSDNQEDYERALTALKEGVAVGFTEMAKIRHETVQAKLPYVISHLETALEEGGKIVTFSHHRDIIEALHHKFSGISVKHYGGMSDVQKQQSVDEFQNNPATKLFCGSIQASGVGITLTASSHVVFSELDWVPGNMTQAEDRTHRIGQKEMVLIQHIVFAGSFDGVMAHKLVAKQEVIDRALDRDRQTLKYEPIVPVFEPRQAGPAIKPVSVTRAQIDEIAPTITKEQREAIHAGLKILAGMDQDRASAINNMGFSKIDVMIGHKFAEALFLTPRQSAYGIRLIRKYRRQLDPDLVERALAKTPFSKTD